MKACEMLFVHFGEPKAVAKAVDKNNAYSSPPRPKGFYAFPYGFVDIWWVKEDPFDEPDGNVECLRAPDGHPLTSRDFYVYDEASGLKEMYRKFREMGGLSFAHKHARSFLDRFLEKGRSGERWELDRQARWPGDIADWLREMGLPPCHGNVEWQHRPSWVRVMSDPQNPPYMTTGGELSQPCDFLLDAKGARIPAQDFFCRVWCPEDFDESLRGGVALVSWKPCQEGDLDWRFSSHLLRDWLDLPLGPLCQYWSDRFKRNVRKLVPEALAKRGIRIEQLFAWPVYPCGEGAYITALKSPHLFSLRGTVWHHLGVDVPRSEILDTYGLSRWSWRRRDGGPPWVKTSVQAFAEALKRREPERFSFHQEAMRGYERFDRLGGPQYDNGRYGEDLVEYYMVFIDEEDAKGVVDETGGWKPSVWEHGTGK